MKSMIRRLYPRIPYKAPIRFRSYGEGDFHDAMVFNFSKGGMYFEPVVPVFPEQEMFLDKDLCIVMERYAPGTYGPESYKSYHGKIRWCRIMPERKEPGYGAGVQIIGKSHVIIDQEEEDMTSCELCGRMKNRDHLSLFDEYVYLCHDCMKHLKGLPEGKIMETLRRFLMGNVC